MKAIFLSDKLKEKLPLLTRVLSNRIELPTLLGFLVQVEDGRLVLSATDLEIGVRVEIPASTSSNGKVCLPGKTIADLLNNMGSEKVSIEAKDKSVEIVGKRMKAVVSSMPREDFPSLYKEKGDVVFSLRLGDFVSRLSRVVFAAGRDEDKPALLGVLIKKTNNHLSMTATDGHRLSFQGWTTGDADKNRNEQEWSFLVPARALAEVSAMKDVDKAVDVFASEKDRQLIFSQDDVLVVTRLIDAKYPPFEKIIPQGFDTKVSFDRDQMQSAIKTCSVFARGASDIVKLSFRRGKIIISASAVSLGENTADIDASVDGEENEIAFNSRYLLDVLSNVKDDNLVFEMTGPLNAGVFRIQDNKDFFHLVMPIKIQE